MAARDLLTIAAGVSGDGLEGAVSEWAKRFVDEAPSELAGEVFARRNAA